MGDTLNPKKRQLGYLRELKGARAGKRYVLNQGVVSLGRDSTNTIPVRDIEVSRVHAKVLRLNDRYRVTDLQSSNGIYLNDCKVEEADLKHGDVLRLGMTTFLFGQDAISDFQDDTDSDTLDRPSKRTASSKRLDVFCNISNVISQTTNFDELLAKILKLIFDWIDADRGCILLAEETSDGYSIAASCKRPGVPPDPISVNQSLLQIVSDTGLPVVINNLAKDKRFRNAQSLHGTGVHEAVCVPIKYHNHLRGFIYFDSFQSTKKNELLINDEHAKLLEAIGAQTAVAVENHLFYSQLLESDRMTAVGEAMTSLSHHIKNIMQGISGGAHILEDGIENESLDLTKQGWEMVQRNQEKMNELVLDMLSFDRGNEPTLQELDLNFIISSVVEKLNTEAPEDQPTIAWTPNKSVEKLFADHKLIFRTVEFLLLNAIDACENMEQGAIHVLLKFDSKEEEFKITISDNGCGIADENLNKIFSLFESTKGDRRTGIGLTLAQKFARDHDGEIYVKSEVGKGSDFTLVLPLNSHSSRNYDELENMIRNKEAAESPS